jgi:nucleoside-diphosphate-sugar epimerase
VILLTGASGFLGTQVRSLCQAREVKLACVYHTVKPELPDSHTWVYADLTSDSSITISERIRVIIHLAARISGNRDEIIQTNVLGTKKLIQFAEERRVERFIFLSTDDIYFSNSWYAQSKRDAEKIVAESNIKWSIVRCPTIFGRYDSKNFSQLSRLVQRYPIIPVPYMGTFIWEPVFVKDVAVHVLSIATQSSGSEGRVSIPVGPEKLRFREIIEQLIRYHGKKRWILPIPNILSSALIGMHSRLMGWMKKPDLIDTFKDKVCTDDKALIVRYGTAFAEIYPPK